MKKTFFFWFVIATIWSCSVEDSVIDEFQLEILPIENASVPSQMRLGETYTINYSYLKPTTCHFFNDLYYISENNVKTIAVINKVLNVNSNIVCETLNNELEEKSFTFLAVGSDNVEGAYIFKFWNGEGSNGQDIYLIFEVPLL